jgi:hypothetical protein
VETYSDPAISRASMIRAGIQALLADEQAELFGMERSEALDRISRDQEDVADVFKPLRLAGVSVVTLSEGEINELHVGLKCTMNALFLKTVSMSMRCSSVRAKSMDAARWSPSRSQEHQGLLQELDDEVKEAGRFHPVEHAMVAGEDKAQLLDEGRRAGPVGTARPPPPREWPTGRD